MIRKSCHDKGLTLFVFRFGTLGKRDAKNLGCLFCIFLIGLIEVTCTEQKECIRMLLLQVKELSEHRTESDSGDSLGLGFSGFFLGFFHPALFLFLLWRVATLLFLLFLLGLRLLFLLLLLLVFLFMGFDILGLLLGLSLCLLLSLVSTDSYGIGTFLT